MILLLSIAACIHNAPRGPSTETTLAAAPLDAEAVAVLQAGAADLDITVRRNAIAVLIEIDPAPAGGAWLDRARFDPSEYVRRSAVDALFARAPDAQARVALRAWTADASLDHWTRGAAAEALARWPEPAGKDEDRRTISDAARSVSGNRSAGLLLAAAMVGDADAKARLERILSAGQVPSELWFLRALGASGVALGELPMDAVEPEIATLFAVAVYQLHPNTRPMLTELLSRDEDAALEVLEGVLNSSIPPNDPILLAPAAGVGARVQALVRFGRGDGELKDVIAALTDADIDIQSFGANAASARLRIEPTMNGADRLRAALRTRLEDAGPAMQLAIIPSLGRSSVPADAAALRVLLQDESPRIRVAAASALLAR